MGDNSCSYLCGDGEDGEDAEGDPSRHGVKVDPEGHPGQEDDQQTGQVGGEDIGPQSALQVKVGPQAGEGTWHRETAKYSLTGSGYYPPQDSLEY